MPLTPAQIANLQAAIDSALSNIPIIMDEWGDRSMSKSHDINDLSDFVYGYILGTVSNAFYYIIFISEGRTPSRQEVAESRKIISDWRPKIREIISRERYRIRMHS